MNILMFSNTYLPHVGGVARSVGGSVKWLRTRGHRVLVAAPSFPGAPEHEEGLIRVPALQGFNGSDFSVPLPITRALHRALADFSPDLVHAHHPFLLGDTALRVAAALDLPMVFTHHTMYEQFTRYVPADSPRLRRFAIELATGYANLCDAVFAPSESVAEILERRGVKTRIDIVPTGVDLAHFAAGDGCGFRREFGIPADAKVVGHVGRLAKEKNLGFLGEALAEFAAGDPHVWTVVVGDGPERATVRARFAKRALTHRLRLTGVRQGPALADAYRAMDVFAFASKSETQGLVLVEALAGGVPVIAVDAPGAREAVVDGVNGRLLPRDEAESFNAALAWALSPGVRERLVSGASRSARPFSIDRTEQKALSIYSILQRDKRLAARSDFAESHWSEARRRIREEWAILRHRSRAVGHSWRSPRVEL